MLFYVCERFDIVVQVGLWDHGFGLLPIQQYYKEAIISLIFSGEQIRQLKG
jgi:hypothetical protein